MIGADANDLWLTLIPVQLFGIVLIIGLAIWLGIIENRRLESLTENSSMGTASIEGTVSSSTNISSSITEDDTEDDLKDEHKNRLWFNGIWTLLVIGTLVWNQLPAYLVFMIGLSVTFLINYPSIREQNDAFSKHAASALMISATMLAAGVMVGIMEGTGMIEAMAAVLTSIVPDILGRFTHVIFGIFALPMGLMVSTDAYFFGFMPPILEVGAQFGVAPINTALAMLVGKNLSLMISPLVPATFLALGLVDDVDYKTHLKFSMKYLWLASILLLIFAFVVGIIQF
ncbi:MAG: SLC13 family permease [Staphylococcus equorum]